MDLNIFAVAAASIFVIRAAPLFKVRKKLFFVICPFVDFCCSLFFLFSVLMKQKLIWYCQKHPACA